MDEANRFSVNRKGAQARCFPKQNGLASFVKISPSFIGLFSKRDFRISRRLVIVVGLYTGNKDPCMLVGSKKHAVTATRSGIKVSNGMHGMRTHHARTRRGEEVVLQLFRTGPLIHTHMYWCMLCVHTYTSTHAHTISLDLSLSLSLSRLLYVGLSVSMPLSPFPSLVCAHVLAYACTHTW